MRWNLTNPPRKTTRNSGRRSKISKRRKSSSKTSSETSNLKCKRSQNS